MQCKVSASTTRCGYGNLSAGASGSATLTESGILCKLTGYANVKMNGIYYNRDGFSISVAFGTKKPLSKSISLYTELNVTETDGYSIRGSLRVGSENNENTTISTATILASGTANALKLLLSDNYPYFVFGDSYSCNAGTGDKNNNPGLSSININRNDLLSEIYLV